MSIRWNQNSRQVRIGAAKFDSSKAIPIPGRGVTVAISAEGAHWRVAFSQSLLMLMDAFHAFVFLGFGV